MGRDEKSELDFGDVIFADKKRRRGWVRMDIVGLINVKAPAACAVFSCYSNGMPCVLKPRENNDRVREPGRS